MQNRDALSPEAAATRVMDGLRLLVREIRHSSTTVERTHGITGAQLFVLRACAAQPGLTINDLAQRTSTHQSSVSTVVTKLVQQGLVRRERSRTDGRATTVTVTRKGLQIAQRAPDPFQDRLLDALQRMASVERLRLAEGMERWITALGLSIDEPCLFFEDDRPRKRT